MPNLSIQDVRAQYPDYNDLSDQELADKLHAKFYSDMPKDDFYSKVGLKTSGGANQGMTDEQRQQRMQQLQYITGANRTPVDTLRDLAYGALTGLGKGGQAIASALTGGYAPTVNMDEVFAPVASPNKSIGGEITKGVGSYAPYAIAGGATLLPEMAAEGGLGAQISSMLANPGQLAAGAGYGAATSEPGEKHLGGWLPSGRLGGALVGAGLNLVPAGLAKGFEMLRPSNLFKSNLSPEQLAKNVEAAAGTQTDIGNVLGNPFLQRQYENVLSKMPMSGAVDAMQQTGQQVAQKGENVLSDVLGVNNPENITDQVNEALIKQFDSHQATKNNLYTQANKIADESGLKLELPNFSKKAQQYSDAIDATNMLKFEPDMQRIFSKLQNYKNPVQQTQNVGAIVDASGQPIINETMTSYPTLQEANLLKGRLNHYAQVAGSSSDSAQRNMARVFGDLSKTLKSDINSTIEASGNKELQGAYQTAEKNYAQNFSPFLDRDIYRYLNGKADPDTIVQKFLKTGQVDRARSLEKLTSKLSPDEQRLIAYSYLSRAVDNEGNLNPGKLATLIGKLGKNQFKTLVPDANLRKQLTDYRTLYNMNTKAVNVMHNPPTGQQALDLMASLGSAFGGAHVGGPIGAVAGFVAPGIASRGIVKAMTSPAVRERLVNAMIENKPKFNTTAKVVGSQSLAQALADLMTNRNK